MGAEQLLYELGSDGRERSWALLPAFVLSQGPCRSSQDWGDKLSILGWSHLRA